MESKKLGKHIAELRRERHMTQTELADRLYITEKDKSETVSEEQILQLQEGNYAGDFAEALPVSQRKNCGRYRFIPFIRPNKQRQLLSLV